MHTRHMELQLQGATVCSMDADEGEAKPRAESKMKVRGRYIHHGGTRR